MFEQLNRNLENLELLLAQVRQIFASLGSVFTYIGVDASLLLLISFVFLFLLNMVSPLDRRVNFFAVIAFTSFVYYKINLSLAGYLRYLAIILAPLILSYSLYWLSRFAKHLFLNYGPRRRPVNHDEIVDILFEAGITLRKNKDLNALRRTLKQIERTIEVQEGV